MLNLILGLAGLVVVLGLLLTVAGQLGLLAGRAPDDLGLRDGLLKRPSKTSNSVSSQADLWPEHPQQAYARIAPLAAAGDAAATMAKIKRVVESTAGAKVVSAQGDYLRAEYTTPLMKYTDDVEFWFDAKAGVVQVRSASRLGAKDFGANRSRVEALRVRLAQG